MRTLVLFWRMIWLRANPQDLPTSPRLLLLALAARVGLNLLDVPPDMGPVQLGIALALDIAVLIVMTELLLHWRGHPDRLVQTLTALAGVGALLSLIEWLAVLAFSGLVPADMIAVASLLWYFGVSGHILHHALERSLAVGVVLSGLYYLIFIVAVAITTHAAGIATST
jgi:hypothetical protein